jgi:hypothetical protein
MTQETIKDILIRLAKTNTSTEQDEKIIYYLLSEKLNIPNVKVTCGLVYYGNYNKPPTDIHSTAKIILNSLNIKY